MFSRCGDTGLCFGFENPYCNLEDNLLYFEPSLILKKGELFECDLNFYGAYEIYGEKIRPELNKSQIYTNGRYGNSSMINYADNVQWKKVDVCGNISQENCIADWQTQCYAQVFQQAQLGGI